MRILVPVDFSEYTESIVDYASQLAACFDGSIHLIHVITPLSASTIFLAQQGDEVEKSVVYLLNDYQERVRKVYGLTASVDVGIGVVTDAILRIARQRKADMIVMGTHGNGRRRMLFGSNTEAILEKAGVPVVAIPEKAAFHRPAKIVFATDYYSAEISDLKKLAGFAAAFDAEVSVVHVVNRFEDDDEDFDEGAVDYFTELVKRKTRYEKFHCEEYQHTDVAEGINCFVREEQADILALSVRHRSVIRNLFTRSLSQKLLFRIEVPLLVFPDESEDL